MEKVYKNVEVSVALYADFEFDGFILFVPMDNQLMIGPRLSDEVAPSFLSNSSFNFQASKAVL